MTQGKVVPEFVHQRCSLHVVGAYRQVVDIVESAERDHQIATRKITDARVGNGNVVQRVGLLTTDIGITDVRVVRVGCIDRILRRCSIGVVGHDATELGYSERMREPRVVEHVATIAAEAPGARAVDNSIRFQRVALRVRDILWRLVSDEAVPCFPTHCARMVVVVTQPRLVKRPRRVVRVIRGALRHRFIELVSTLRTIRNFDDVILILVVASDIEVDVDSLGGKGIPDLLESSVRRFV